MTERRNNWIKSKDSFFGDKSYMTKQNLHWISQLSGQLSYLAVDFPDPMPIGNRQDWKSLVECVWTIFTWFWKMLVASSCKNDNESLG